MEDQKHDSIRPMDIELLQVKTEEQPRYRSGLKMTSMGFIICITGIMFGYALTQISTIPIKTLVKEYHITFSPSLAQGLLIGLMPFGGIFGAILYKYILAYLRRRTSLFFIACWMVLAVGLMQITTIETLMIGRFLQGICVGLYVSVGPIYLREVVAKQLRPQITSIYSLCKIIGIVIAYSIQDIMIAANYTWDSWRILLCFNGIFCTSQAVLVFFFVPESPVQMIQRQDYDTAKRIVGQLYKDKYKDEVLGEIMKDDEAAKARKIEKDAQKGLKLVQNKKRALRMAIHITTFRQLIGANVLVTFSGQIVAVFIKGKSSIAEYTGLIVNCFQLFSNTVTLFTITKKFGRRPIFVVGSIGVTILNFGIAFALLFQVQYLIIVMMCIYMLLYGATCLPVAWSVPSEIVPPDEAIYANVPGWIATSIVVTCPPIVSGAMPNGNSYPLFFFFGAYGIFASIVLYNQLIQTKGKTYEQIINQF